MHYLYMCYEGQVSQIWFHCSKVFFIVLKRNEEATDLLMSKNVRWKTKLPEQYSKLTIETLEQGVKYVQS